MSGPRVLCRECFDAKEQSLVYEDGAGMTTCVYYPPYYDVDGNRHDHDANRHTQPFRCSRGHRFTKQLLHSCWCGWQQKDES